MRILYLLFPFILLLVQGAAAISIPGKAMFLRLSGPCFFGKLPQSLINLKTCFCFNSCCTLCWDV
uniref:Uncharacterized protein n=1 Tax=Anas platyrhynchos TaxID=8839 RepID=A0A8B9QQT5_ANAPL